MKLHKYSDAQRQGNAVIEERGERTRAETRPRLGLILRIGRGGLPGQDYMQSFRRYERARHLDAGIGVG